MKKMILKLLTVITMAATSIVMSSSVVVASWYYPSKSITDTERDDTIITQTDEVRQRLDIQESDEVYRLYSIDILYNFDRCNNIDEVFEKGKLFGEIYMVKNEDGDIYYKEFDTENKVHVHDGLNPYEKTRTVFLTDRENIIRKFSPDIEINKIYYLEGINYSGSAIYYKTNKGDYVYYYDGTEYLFPIKELCELSKEVYDEVRSFSEDYMVGYPGIRDNEGKLSRYNINSPDFNLNSNNYIVLLVCIIGGVILLAAAGIIVGIRVRKKRK